VSNPIPEAALIRIWADEEPPPGKPAVPMADLTRRVAVVTNEFVAENLQKFMRAFDPVIEGMSSAAGRFYVDEIEVSLAIDAKGGVQLIGKMEAGAQATLKVKLKRRPDVASSA
jgi:hypothetical protein